MANPVNLKSLFSLWLLPVLSLSGWLSLMSPRVSAQITPDATLGAESSRIRAVNQVRDLIEGGAIRGGNLFHSFEDFNIGEGQEAYFANPAGIANILSRVTGSDVSDILGTLGVDGTANLFFLNPNGIIFAPNARLDIGGSFVATTAERFTFPDGSSFSAVDSAPPSLLMINVPVGLQYGTQAPGAIISQGSRLIVEEGRSLILVGGEIQLNNSLLTVDFFEGGRIELGAVGGEGTVGLSQSGSLFNLNFPSGLTRSDIFVANRSLLDVLAENGGGIGINARNLEISDSRLEAGIASGLGFPGAQAGNIEIHATESVTLSSSNILNRVNAGATGSGGNILINTRSFEMSGRNRGLSASTFGEGDAGRIVIDAPIQVFLDSGLIFNNVDVDAIGNTNGIEITTGSLRLINDSQLRSDVSGRGNSIGVTVSAEEQVSIDNDSNISSNLGEDATGDAGDIEISTGVLRLDNASQVSSSSLGEGQSGRVIINAKEQVSLNNSSSILSLVEGESASFSGGIAITAGTLLLTDGSQIGNGVLGRGTSGRIVINTREQTLLDDSSIISNIQENTTGSTGGIQVTTRDLRLTNGAQLISSTLGQGNSGGIVISVGESTVLDGFNRNRSSALFSSVGSSAGGNSGGIQMSTDSLSITNGAIISAETRGNGNAGSVRIDAQGQVYLDGSGSNGPSRIISTVRDFANGTVNGVSVNANSLILTSSGAIFASTSGIGDAGPISIRVERFIHLEGLDTQTGRFSGIFNTTEAVAGGDGGTIDIYAQDIRLTGGAVISTDTFGVNDGGDITVNANTLEADNGGEILSSAFGAGKAGNVRLNIFDNLILRGSNPIYFEVIELLGENFRNIIDNVGPASGVFAVTRGGGTGGTIMINTPRIIVQDGAEISAATGPEVSEELGAINNGFGRPGSIFIRGADSII